MAITGKSGADAIFISLKHICHVLTTYQLKLTQVVAAARAAGAITAAQETAINNLIATAVTACAAFEALALYSGF